MAESTVDGVCDPSLLAAGTYTTRRPGPVTMVSAAVMAVPNRVPDIQSACNWYRDPEAGRLVILAINW